MPALKEQLQELIDTARAFEPCLAGMEALLPVFEACVLGDGKILTCGNGGSATDAMHLAEELVGRYRKNRRALPAVALVTDGSALSCIANDWEWNYVFSRQVEALGKAGDMLVVFSTSGNSPSIVGALETARKIGLKTVAFLGKDGGKCKGMADYEVIVPSSNTARIQEIHTWILHAMLEWIEERI